MRFQHPVNEYREAAALPLLFALIVGPVLYFAAKGIWRHVFISLLLLTPFASFSSEIARQAGLGPASWILNAAFYGVITFCYAGFAPMIVSRHYLRQGWTKVD